MYFGLKQIMITALKWKYNVIVRIQKLGKSFSLREKKKTAVIITNFFKRICFVCSHFKVTEKSSVKSGFLNPHIVSHGRTFLNDMDIVYWPHPIVCFTSMSWRRNTCQPKWMDQATCNILITECFLHTGGSRTFSSDETRCEFLNRPFIYFFHRVLLVHICWKLQGDGGGTRRRDFWWFLFSENLHFLATKREYCTWDH